MQMRTSRELQSILKRYRQNVIIPACEVRLNAKRAVLEQAIIDCLHSEKGLCTRKIELNPTASKKEKKEWIETIALNTRELEIITFAA
jgi:hypothetical protein